MPTEYKKSHIQGILKKNGKKYNCIILYCFFREVISKTRASWALSIQPKIPVQNQMEWNFRKINFENFGQPLEVAAFPGNLEIPGIFCSIGHSISLDAQSQFLQP